MVRITVLLYSLIGWVVMDAGSAHAQSTWKILPNAPALENGRYEDIYFVNEKIGWVVRPGTIIKTSDGGASWQVQLSDDSVGSLRSVAFVDTMRGWAGTIDGQLLQTNDGGAIWTRIDPMISPAPAGVCDLSVVNDSAVFGSGRWRRPADLLISTDAGAHWENKSLAAYASLLVGCKFLTPTSGFVVGASSIESEGGVVLYTADGGTTWETRHKTMRTNEHVWNVVFVTPAVGYATVQNPHDLDTLAVIKTIDGGLTWQRKTIGMSRTSFRYAEAIGFATEKRGWVASGIGSGIYETLDGGDTWTLLDLGVWIHGMHILNDSVGYACGRTIYKHSPDVSTGVKEEPSLPLSHRLHQNYPNPFNASTTISYSLPERMFAWLSIYNLEGRLVETLQRGYQEAGDHRIVWDAKNFSSGVYIYSLRTDEGIFVGKAMLVK